MTLEQEETENQAEILYHNDPYIVVVNEGYAVINTETDIIETATTILPQALRTAKFYADSLRAIRAEIAQEMVEDQIMTDTLPGETVFTTETEPAS